MNDLSIQHASLIQGFETSIQKDILKCVLTVWNIQKKNTLFI